MNAQRRSRPCKRGPTRRRVSSNREHCEATLTSAIPVVKRVSLSARLSTATRSRGCDTGRTILAWGSRRNRRRTRGVVDLSECSLDDLAGALEHGHAPAPLRDWPQWRPWSLASQPLRRRYRRPERNRSPSGAQPPSSVRWGQTGAAPPTARSSPDRSHGPSFDSSPRTPAVLRQPATRRSTGSGRA